MPTVRMPDGSTAQFPDNMSVADIQSAIETHLAQSQRPAGLPPGVDLPQLPAHPAVNMQSSALSPGLYTKRLADNAAGLLRPLTHPVDSILSYRPGEAIENASHSGPIQDITQNPDKGEGVANAIADIGTGLALGKASQLAGGAIEGAARGIGKGLQYASASPESLKVAATRAITPGTPGELLTRALKPPVTMPDFETSVERTLPKIAAQKPNGVKGFSEAAMNLKNASNDWYKNLVRPYASEPIDTTPIVGQQLRSIPATNLFENPGIVDSTAAKASAYDMTPITKTSTSRFVDEFGKPYISTEVIEPAKPTLSRIDAIREDTNAKLNDFYNKSGGDKHAALANPETARLKAVNDGARDLVYDRLASRSGIPRSDIEANQELYGHATDIANVAGKRATVAGRANPMSLQESIAVRPSIRGAADFLGQRLLKNLTNSDAITNAALDRFANPSGPTLLPRSNIFAEGANALGKKLSTARSSRLLPQKLPPYAGLFKLRADN